LEIDHGLDAAVELEECSSGFARDHLIENGHVSLAKLIDLGVDIQRALEHAERLVVSHGAPVLGVFLDKVIFGVVNFDEVGSVLVVNGPELGSLIRSELKIGGDKLFLFGANVLSQEMDILIEFLLLTGSGRLRRGRLGRSLRVGTRHGQKEHASEQKGEDEFQFHGRSPLEICEWTPAGGAGRRDQHFRK